MRQRRSLLARIARVLAQFALTLVAILVTAVVFFPFERLAPALARWIEAETRIATSIGALDAGFGARGPVLEARDIQLYWPTGEQFALDSLRVSPALSLAWLRGVPTLRVAGSAEFGAFEGVVSADRIEGDFTRFDFAALPPAWFGDAGSPLAGPVHAKVALARVAEQWSGAAQIVAADGSLALPGSPVAIPYEALKADLRLDEVGTLHVESVALSGPMVAAQAQGEVAAGYAGPATGAIAIEADLTRMDPALVPALAAFGVQFDARGAGHLSISGTPEQIVIR
jgi:type II secretion system protein N